MTGRWKPVIRLLIIAVVIAGLLWAVRSAVDELVSDPDKRRLLWRIHWPSLWGGAGAYLLALLPAGFYWYWVLRSFAVPVPAGRAVAAHVQGHLGKYVPGKAMVVVLRVGAIVGPGVSPLLATVAVFIETLTMMATGATLAALVIALSDVPQELIPLAIALGLVSAVPTMPPLFRMVVAVVVRRRDPSHRAPLEAYRWTTFAAGWAWMTLSWCLIGTAFALIVHAIAPQTGLDDLVLAAALMALAVVAGFVSLIPGGAGVRELILTAALAPRIGTAEALSAALLARLVFLAVELAAAGGSAVVLRRTGPRDSVSEQPSNRG
ncbi:lysylphosphatidylglycerol synthase domain-containing protein [Roseimaritima sediminicola]|uniref:lysylphosphatidylglycerol synthase domain-containing protein n=1 Tax=Roseimaritima sediminicola TaxID=2662066 RepID=UPI0013865FD0|nr:lysylphosphatidylglycerol synthase domain-containing protein [Roseimaritima sediminicola]